MSLRQKFTMTIFERERKERNHFRLSQRDCPSMAVSPDELILLYCYLSCYLPKKRRDREKNTTPPPQSSKVIFIYMYIAYSLANISSKFNRDRETRWLSILRHANRSIALVLINGNSNRSFPARMICRTTEEEEEEMTKISIYELSIARKVN